MRGLPYSIPRKHPRNPTGRSPPDADHLNLGPIITLNVRVTAILRQLPLRGQHRTILPNRRLTAHPLAVFFPRRRGK